MKRNLVRLMLGLAIAAVVQFAFESQVEAGFGGHGRLLGGRNRGGNSCGNSCQPTCCEAAPAPSCECESSCDNGCGGGRHRLFGGRHRGGCNNGCNSCGCGGTVETSGGTPPVAPTDPGTGAAPTTAPAPTGRTGA